MKIILVNAPPRAGKDTSGNLIKELRLRVDTDKFARVLKDAAHAVYGLDVHHEHFDRMKGEEREEFLGRTPRDVYIAMSEQFMKYLHGPRVFGELLLRRLRSNRADYVVVTDSGFREEAEVLVEAYGSANVLLIRLRMDGATYSGDSRGYIDLADLGVRCVDVESVLGDIDGLRASLNTELDKWEE